ncbi:MAG: hypothetical protein C4334_01775 [Pyrinomonas sp.]
MPFNPPFAKSTLRAASGEDAKTWRALSVSQARPAPFPSGCFETGNARHRLRGAENAPMRSPGEDGNRKREQSGTQSLTATDGE